MKQLNPCSLCFDKTNSPERVVRLGELSYLEISHLKVANIVHRDLELHRDRADLPMARRTRRHRSMTHVHEERVQHYHYEPQPCMHMQPAMVSVLWKRSVDADFCVTTNILFRMKKFLSPSPTRFIFIHKIVI